MLVWDVVEEATSSFTFTFFGFLVGVTKETSTNIGEDTTITNKAVIRVINNVKDNANEGKYREMSGHLVYA